MTYLDFNASTPPDPRVLEVMIDALRELPGNASSVQHRTGQLAAEAAEVARERVARLVGAQPNEVLFTSGASESLTLAVLGSILGNKSRPNVVVGATEHKAVLSAAALAADLVGGEVRIAPVSRDGVLDLSALEGLMGPEVGLVAVMHANNETGAIQPVADAAAIARESGSLMLCDVTQSVGKLPVERARLGADMMAFSSHKIYGPKGAGALVAPRHVQKMLTSIFPGGGQERGLRGGTLDTPSLVGFGMAAELARSECDADAEKSGQLISQLIEELGRRISGVELVGPRVDRLCNTANLRFVGADAEEVMACARNIEVATGSACQAAVPTVSHVLLAMGLSRAEASECLRFSVGRSTTGNDIECAAESIASAVGRVRRRLGP